MTTSAPNHRQTIPDVHTPAPCIAIQTNGTIINPSLKLALEKSLSKVLFGNKDLAPQRSAAISDRDQIKNVNIENENLRMLSLNVVPQICDFESQNSVSVLRKNNRLLHEAEKPSSKTLMNTTTNDHTELSTLNPSESYNDICMSSPSPYTSISYNNNQNAYQKLDQTTSLDYEMPSSVASSSTVCSEMLGSVETSSKVSGSVYESSEGYSPVSDFDLDFDKIVDDVENLYREEQLRNLEGHLGSKKDNKNTSISQNDYFLNKTKPHRTGNKSNFLHGNFTESGSHREKDILSSQFPLHRSDAIFPVDTQTNNNNTTKSSMFPTCTKFNELTTKDHSNLSSYGENDKDTNILVENFSEVASNRALAHITDCVIEEILETITATSCEWGYNKPFVEAKEKHLKDRVPTDLDTVLSGFLNEIVSDMPDQGIEKSFGGLYRNTEIKITDNEYLLSSKNDPTYGASKLARWKGTSHTCDEKCQKSDEKTEGQKEQERTYNAGGSATNNPLYRMKLLRRRIKRLKEKKMQTDKVSKRKSSKTRKQTFKNTLEFFGETSETNELKCADYTNKKMHNNQQINPNRYLMIETKDAMDNSKVNDIDFSNKECGKCDIVQERICAQPISNHLKEHNERMPHVPSGSKYNSYAEIDFVNPYVIKKTNANNCEVFYDKHRILTESQKQEHKPSQNVIPTNLDLIVEQGEKMGNKVISKDTGDKSYLKIQAGVRKMTRKPNRSSIRTKIDKVLNTDDDFLKHENPVDRKTEANVSVHQRRLENDAIDRDHTFSSMSCETFSTFDKLDFLGNANIMDSKLESKPKPTNGSLERKEGIDVKQEPEKKIVDVRHNIEGHTSESTWKNEKLNSSDHGNYDPCTMIDDEPDSIEPLVTVNSYENQPSQKFINKDGEVQQQETISSEDQSNKSSSILTSL